jgi:type IV pilus assembly protein PilW
MHAPHARFQRGFSLIELSVSIIIALFLLAGLTTLVMHTRNASTTQSQLEQLQENERIAMTILANVIQEAGYFPDPTNNTASSITAQTVAASGTGYAFASGAAISLVSGQALSGQSNAAAPGDAIAARFMAPKYDTANSGILANSIINCAGAVSTDASNFHTFTNVFQVANVNGTTYLQCVLADVNNATGTTVTQTVNLVPGLYEMQVLYGVATGTDNNITEYVTAATVTSTNNWENVTAVKIRLYFQIPQYGFSGGQINSAATSSAVTNGVQYIERVIAIMNRTGVNT